jgi:hypothetical protein
MMLEDQKYCIEELGTQDVIVVLDPTGEDVRERFIISAITYQSGISRQDRDERYCSIVITEVRDFAWAVEKLAKSKTKRAMSATCGIGSTR